MAVHAILAHLTARAARNARDQDPVTRLVCSNGTSAFFDDADTLVSDGGPFLTCWHVTLKDMQVGAADGGVDDFDYSVSGFLNGRLRLVLKLDGIFAAKDECFHAERFMRVLAAGNRAWV